MKSARNEGWIVPDWPAPARVCSLITCRCGGVSAAPYASLNLATHVGDDPLAVAENRRRLARSLPATPYWLNQVHGTTLAYAISGVTAGAASAPLPVADGALTREAGVACVVLTADCLPVLLCDRKGGVVVAVHAGWRGLRAGVLERAVAATGVPGEHLLAYLGPAIGAQSFEVGDEVRAAFVGEHAAAAAAFDPVLREPAIGSGAALAASPGKWLADLYLLARLALRRVGVDAIFGGGYCTLQEEGRFFSYRRDGVTGRMASSIWLADA